MGLEVARCFVRVLVDRVALRSDVAGARADIIRGLSNIQIRIGIDRAFLVSQAVQAGRDAGRAATVGFQSAFRAGGAGGMSMGRSAFTSGQRYSIPTSREEARQMMGLGRDDFASQRAWMGRNTPPGGWGRGGMGAAAGEMGGGGGRFANSFLGRSAATAVGILGYRAAIHSLMAPVGAARAAASFGQEILRFGQATQGTPAEMEQMRAQALRLGGGGTLFGPGQVAHAARIIGEKGLNAGETSGALPTVLDFAAASGGKVDVEGSADVLIGIMNSMRIPMDRLSDTANVLARAALKSSTDVRELGDAFKYVGPLADLAGMNLEETAAALMVLSKKNLGGSLGGTGFKRIITELFGAEGLSEIEKATGRKIRIRDEDGRIDLPRIIDDINKAFKDAGVEGAKLGAIMEQFEQRAGPQFAALLQAGGDAIRAEFEKIQDKTIDIHKMHGEQLEILAGKFARTSGAWERLGIVLEGLVDGPLSRMIDGTAELARWMEHFANWAGGGAAGAPPMHNLPVRHGPDFFMNNEADRAKLRGPGNPFADGFRKPRPFIGDKFGIGNPVDGFMKMRLGQVMDGLGGLGGMLAPIAPGLAGAGIQALLGQGGLFGAAVAGMLGGRVSTPAAAAVDRPGFRSNLVGIEDLSRTIQTGVVSREEQTQKQIEKNTKEAAEKAGGIIDALKNLNIGARFG